MKTRGFTLAQKSILLVSSVLVLELIFMGTMSYMLKQSEWETMRYVRGSANARIASKMLWDFYRAGSTLTVYAWTRQGKLGAGFDQAASDVREDLGQLKQSLSSIDEPGHASPKQLAAAADKAISQMVHYKHSIDTESDIPLLELRKLIQPTAFPFFEQMKEYIAKEDEFNETKLPEAARENRDRMQMIIVGCVIFNIIGALTLLNFFIKSFTSKIDVLTDNTVRLATGMELNKPLSGNDELSNLDHVFHSMADQLRQLQQMKTEFVSMVSHDLRTPLTSIKSTLQVINRGACGEIPEEAQQMLESADQEVNRLTRLIEDLLDIARIESGKMHLVHDEMPLQTVLERALVAVKNLAETAGIAIYTPSSTYLIFVDRERLVQVLINLLSNAIKFSPRESVITISATQDAEFVEVSVRDQGRGVPEEHHQSIFERFQQVELSDAKEKKGTGLGLPICKSIIEQHGGRIGVRNNPDSPGATFWFTVPRA